MLQMTARIHSLLTATSFVALALTTTALPSAAYAQSVRTPIDMPAMPMAQALQSIAAQTGAAIDYDPDAVKGLTSRPVRGAKNARRAVEMATKGTPLSILPGSNGQLTIVNDIVVIANRDEAETDTLVRRTSTSDRNGLSLRNQPRNNQVITGKTIEDQQALSVTEALRNAGGVTTLSGTSGPARTIRFAASTPPAWSTALPPPRNMVSPAEARRSRTSNASKSSKARMHCSPASAIWAEPSTSSSRSPVRSNGWRSVSIRDRGGWSAA